MFFDISERIYKKISKRLEGWIYRDCTDILGPLLEVKLISKEEARKLWNKLDEYEKEVEVSVSVVYRVDENLFLAVFMDRDGKLLYGLWRDSKDIVISHAGEVASIIHSMNFGREFMKQICLKYKDKRFGVYQFNKRYYCSKVTDVVDSIEGIVKAYIRDKKERLIREIENKYGISAYLPERTDIDTVWEKTKAVYKDFMNVVKSNSDRIFIAKRLHVKDLVEAGWEYFRKCDACEPPQMEKVLLFNLFIMSTPYSDWYKIYSGGIVLAWVPGEVIGAEKGRDYTFTDLEDWRIRYYLSKSPDKITTTLEEICYFKWAVEQVKKMILKEYEKWD